MHPIHLKSYQKLLIHLSPVELEEEFQKIEKFCNGRDLEAYHNLITIEYANRLDKKISDMGII